LRFLLVLALLAISASSSAQARHLRHPGDAARDRADQEGEQEHGDKPARFATAIDRMILACGKQAAELRTLPLEAITRSVRLGDDQREALEQVRSSANGAAKTLDAKCPKRIPRELTAKIDVLDDALGLIADSLVGLRPAFETFYGLLEDEQKGRLLTMNLSGSQPSRPDRAAARKEPASAIRADGELKSMCAQWAANLRSWPVRQIESRMQLSDEQHAKLYELTAATYRSAGDLAEACPLESRVTPLGRLDAKQHELQALRQDIQAIRPFAAAFENALNAAQRKRLAEEVDVATGVGPAH
jgi:hypothetical protein